MQITSLLDACQCILGDQGEPQSSYWLASQIVEMKLWRASEADVWDALATDIEERGESSRFMRSAEDEFGLRSWINEKRAVEYQPTSDIENQFPSVAKWVRSYGWIEVGSEQSFGFVCFGQWRFDLRERGLLDSCRCNGDVGNGTCRVV